MKILILGSSASVHSILWKLCQSEKYPIHIILAPANFELISELRSKGSEKTIECLDTDIYDIERLSEIAMVRGIDLCIPCEAELYELGIVDKFRELGLSILGPKKASARLESSRFFARELMYEANIPAPKYAAFDNIHMAKAFLPSIKIPSVLRADNPFGMETSSIIAREPSQAEAFIESYFGDFSQKSARVIIEEYIEGPLYSIATICDGEQALSLPIVQSYRDLDLDLGGYAPAPELNDTVMFAIRQQIIDPCIAAMKAHQSPYTGFLVFDVVVLSHREKPSLESKVVEETNLDTQLELYLVQVRSCLNDTEAHVIMPLLDEELCELLKASARADLSYFADGLHRYPGSALNINLIDEAEDRAEEELIKEKIHNSIKEMSASLNAAALIFEGSSNMTTKAKLRKLSVSGEQNTGKKILSTTAVAETLIDAQILAYKMAETASSLSPNVKYKRDIGDQGML